MKKTLLKWIPLDAIIDHVVEWLASTIKNPGSAGAQRAKASVERLRDACNTWLERVGE